MTWREVLEQVQIQVRSGLPICDALTHACAEIWEPLPIGGIVWDSPHSAVIQARVALEEQVRRLDWSSLGLVDFAGSQAAREALIDAALAQQPWEVSR